jgi:hypothetical protein
MKNKARDLSATGFLKIEIWISGVLSPEGTAVISQGREPLGYGFYHQ